MKMAKKAFSIVIAFVMLINVFAVMGSAAGTESAVDLYIRTDKDTYAPGEEITFTVSAQAVSAVGNLRIGGGYAIGFNSKGVVALSDDVTSLNSHGFTALKDGYDASISGLAATDFTSVDAANNWDSVMILAVADDLSTSFDATSSVVDLFTFKMKVADDAADGSYVVGWNKTSYEDYNAYINDAAMGGIYGYADDYGYGTTVNYGFNNCTVTVSSAEPSIVNPLKGQIRFDKDANGAYANTFDVRALAVITGADFTATFGDEATAEEMIVKAGFVFANGANVTAPSMDAVKALVENGTAAAGYTYKEIGFISSSVQPGNYVFSCIVNNVGDADKTNSLVAVGFIAYEKDGVTQYAYYPTAQTISFNELYTTYYGQAFPA